MAKLLGDSLIKEFDVEEESKTVSYLNEGIFLVDYPSEDYCKQNNVTFSLKGKELSAKAKQDKIKEFTSGEVYATVTHNSDGLPYYIYAEVKDATFPGAQGSISGSITLTYTF